MLTKYVQIVEDDPRRQTFGVVKTQVISAVNEHRQLWSEESVGAGFRSPRRLDSGHPWQLVAGVRDGGLRGDPVQPVLRLASLSGVRSSCIVVS
jgi:hypothetical protein